MIPIGPNFKNEHAQHMCFQCKFTDCPWRKENIDLENILLY